ncbi:lamin tail domain-containing protein [Patescibacteria group bacterium]|nr:lamin tail domain-containing protein [Patescibacteria group bacterium]
MKYFLATLILTITLPLVAQAEVQINEIAWMGVSGTNGQYGEWFELYNSGNEPVDLSGWKLYKSGGEKLIYTFSGTIASGEYYIVERITASVPDPLVGIGNEAGAFGSSGFANTGEFLVLKNSEGIVVHTIDQSSGWKAGDATTKSTMQYSGAGWITATPTPGQLNSSVATVPIVVEQKNTTDSNPLYSTQQGDLGGVRTKESQEKILPLLVRARKDPHIDFTFPTVVYTGNIYDFVGAVTLEYTTPSNGVFVWNMGDGTIIRTTENTPVRHTYRYEGIYTVTLSYFPTDRYGKAVIWATSTVIVHKADITIGILDSSTLSIKNNSNTLVDLSYWVITTPHGAGAVPDMTLLAPGATIALSTQTLSIGPLSRATLATINGTVVASTNNNTVTTVHTQNNSSRVLSSKVVPYSVPLEPLSVPQEYEADDILHTKNSTKNILIGGVIVVLLGSLLFLERFIAYRE